MPNDTFSLGLVTPVMQFGEINTSELPYYFFNKLVSLYNKDDTVTNLMLDKLSSRLLSTESATFGSGRFQDLDPSH